MYVPILHMYAGMDTWKWCSCCYPSTLKWMFRTTTDGLHFTWLAGTFSTELLFFFFFWQKAPNVIASGHFEFVTYSPLPTGCLQLIYEYLGLREQALVCLIENFVYGCMPTCVRTYVRPQTAYCFHPLCNITLLVLHIHVPIQRTVQQSIQ